MKKTIIFAAVAAVLGTASCNFEDLNRNPNTVQVGEIYAYNCLEPLIYGTAQNIQQFTWFWNNELVQMSAYTAGATRQEHQYQVTDGNWQSIWDAYARYGYDAHHMIQLARKDEDKFLEGVGLVMKVHCLSNLVSLFGDIPYDEAYRGQEGITTPKFEAEEEVFNKLLRDLESANVILAENPKTSKAELDGMYNGNASNWRKYANSLKIRLLCRMASADDKYWAEIAGILANPDQYPVFESNDDNAFVTFSGTDPYMSYFGKDKTTDADFTGHRITEQMVKMTLILDKDGNATYQDPRLAFWAKMRGKKWKGTVAGCSEGERTSIDKDTAIPNAAILKRADMPAFYMDYSELLFIYAEGVMKGKLTMPESAKAYYEAAVTASMEKWTEFTAVASTIKPIKKADITKFLASDLAAYDKAGTEGALYGSAEELLHSQKWLSLYYVLFEPYHEWRRTEYPLLTIGSGTTPNNNELPTRLGYPNYTASSNRANVQEALDRMGGENDMHTALWWSYKKQHDGTHRNAANQ